MTHNTPPFVHFNQAGCLLKHAQPTSPALGIISGYPSAGSEHTGWQPWFRCATSPAASLSPGLTATIWPPFDVGQGQSPVVLRQRLNPWWEPVGKAALLSFSPASTIWLVKQIALSSCSPICPLSWALCAAASTVPQFPPSAVFLLRHHKHSHTCTVAPVSGESPRHQFNMFAIKNLYCSLQMLEKWNNLLLFFCTQVSHRLSVL